MARAPHKALGDGWPHWTSPEEVVSRLRAMGGVHLDPCSNPASIVGAAVELDGSPGRNGLRWSWVNAARTDAQEAAVMLGEHPAAQSRLTYVNPPFGREVERWAAKAAEEGRLGAEIVWLAPARTDTEWFHRSILQCRALVFWRGRIAFGNPPDPDDHSGGALATGVAVAYWGRRRQAFRDAFAPAGLFVVPGCGFCAGHR